MAWSSHVTAGTGLAEASTDVWWLKFTLLNTSLIQNTSELTDPSNHITGSIFPPTIPTYAITLAPLASFH